MRRPSAHPHAAVKIALWAYFWLLLAEGVLRKWVLPQYSDILFVARDPLVLVTYVLAWRAGVFPLRPAMMVVWLLATLSLIFALQSETPSIVTLFGLRTNYLHLPLVFIMAQVMDRDDVLRFGRWFMWCALPILVLMVLQFNSEPDAWINVGVGGKASAQLRGALGRIRPPGPFSFIGGVVGFFALTTAFVIYGWMRRSVFPRWLLILSTVAAAAAVPISISRSLGLAVLVVAVFAIVVSIFDLRRIPLYLTPLIVIGLALIAAADTVYVQPLLARWDEAVTVGGGNFYTNVVGRLLAEFTQPFEVATEAPLFGHGIGLGTVAGARLTTGEESFLLAEAELARIVLELGPLLGFAFIGWRLWLAGLLLVKSWQTFRTTHDTLSWLLAGASFLPVLHGQWGPATQLGFAIFGAGLALGATKEPTPVAEAGIEGAAPAAKPKGRR